MIECCGKFVGGCTDPKTCSLEIMRASLSRKDELLAICDRAFERIEELRWGQIRPGGDYADRDTILALFNKALRFAQEATKELNDEAKK